MIHIEQLHKAFKKNRVLREIDLEFKPGRITAILGPNGSGKTTLIKCILGMVIPDAGRIRLDGKIINKAWEYRRDIAYLSQIARFPENLKVKEIFMLLQDIRGHAPRLDTLVEQFGLGPYLDVRLSTLSGGTRQKVNLVQALMFDSSILILDEPTNGLDPIAVVQLKALIREEKSRGRTILMTSHIMQFVEETADDLVFLLDGRVHFNGALKNLLDAYETPDLEYAIAQVLKGRAPGHSMPRLSANGKMVKDIAFHH